MFLGMYRFWLRKPVTTTQRGPIAADYRLPKRPPCGAWAINAN
jgi:hypothetical protein